MSEKNELADEMGAAPHDIACDVVIVGCGVAGLYCALNLPSTLSVMMLAKTTVGECDSMLAQGGICVQHDDADYAPFFEDTLRAGHYENRCESVDLMIRASRSIISDLVKRGVDFERDQAGNLRYTREGAHSRPRICFHGDITGDEITSTLLARVRELPNVRILEHTCMDDILVAQDDVKPHQPQTRCRGVVAHTADGGQLRIFAGQTLWACGGIGGTYPRSTNFPSLTGDACAIAARHGIALEHIDYVQIHPTSLYSTRPGRAFLISESCRGEGAVLLDANGNRFTDELQPRDVVSAAIYRQMAAEGTDFVRLSFATMPKDEITGHFGNIYKRCLEEGFDITREPIPVVPAQHYFMGGVRVDRNSATDMPGLYAAGETSCNGVHGKNRLASNSLLESLVFAQRAAWDMCRKLGVEAPVAQTYPEQPCGADAQAYERLCAEAERKTHENAAQGEPQTAAQTRPQTCMAKRSTRQAATLLAKPFPIRYRSYRKLQGGRLRMNPITLTTVAEPLIRQALAEDITNEDVSTAAIMPDARPAAVDLIAKADGVLCGLDVFERTFAILDPETRVQRFAADGDSVCAGQTLATVTGDVRVLLSGERVALNYLQRMSGIATYTHRVAALLEGSITQLVDTRKTTPNMRVFEKEAVRCGGGRNHRYNLSDGVLLKDNHIAAAGGVREAIEAARAHAPFVREIEVECETFTQVEEAIAARADIIMLDNMDRDAMAKAIAFIDGRAKTECSGNIDAHNVQAIADLGIDFVSSGALTHSAPILDVSMKHLRMLDGNADGTAIADGNTPVTDIDRESGQ